ncbi:MAG TPA: hypothetical protein VEF04_16970, partial [Blastocatellia bacterium]|nr:hypothetical protein [Blastocatellia bacterium]
IRNRVHSIVAPETGRPLNVVTINGENQMWDQDFLYWVRHRLLIPLTPRGHRCVDTDIAIDPDLDHAFYCLKRGRGIMHSFVKNAVNDACKGIARRTGERVTNEPPIAQWLKPDLVNNKNEKTIEGLKLRRADVMIEPELAVASIATKTVTLIDVRHCAMNSPQREEDIGVALREGQKAKETDYKTHFDFPAGVTLLPSVLTPWTRSMRTGRNGWKTTAPKQQRVTNDSTSTTTSSPSSGTRSPLATREGSGASYADASRTVSPRISTSRHVHVDSCVDEGEATQRFE